MTESKIIALPAEAIELWKNVAPLKLKVTPRPPFFLSALMISAGAGLATFFMLKPYEMSAPDLWITVAGVFVFTLVLGCVKLLQLLEHVTNQSFRHGVQKTILYSCGYDNIDPNECSIGGDNAISAYHYLIVPLESSHAPAANS